MSEFNQKPLAVRTCSRIDPLDRRRNHVKALFYQFVNPRRRNERRRESDTRDYLVDHHEPMLLLVVLLILLLCIVDVYATLTLLQRGGVELNPFMDKLIKYDVWVFFGLKYGLTAGGLALLLAFRKFRIFRYFASLQTLYGILIVYAILVVYEIKLLVLSY